MRNQFIRSSFGLEREEPQKIAEPFSVLTKRGVAHSSSSDCCPKGIQSVAAWCLLRGASGLTEVRPLERGLSGAQVPTSGNVEKRGMRVK